MNFQYKDDEDIKKSMLENIDDKVLRATGTFTNDLLSPVAIELAERDIELSVISSKLYAENLEGEELDMRVKEWTNLDRRKATKANGYVEFTGEDNTVIEKGTIVSNDTTNYETIAEVTVLNNKASVKIECIEPGGIGNTAENTIVNCNIQGINSVTNKEAFINGYEEETDDELLKRYNEALWKPTTSGNEYHYEMWAEEVEGVGVAKAVGLWQGAGTVKVIIIDRNKGIASEELINNVYEHIEKKRPIGADVTVKTGNPKVLNISAGLSLANNYEIESIKKEFEEELEKYRREVTFSASYISYAKIGAILLSINGVLDHNNLKLNNDIKNISLESEDIPIFSNISLEVIE